MALHNPVLEAAARIQYALKRGDYVTLDGCRRHCAENKEQALNAVAVAVKLIDDLRSHNLILPAGQTARPLSEWHEDMGDMLWWKFPVEEPPYVGSPKDLGFPVELHTQDGPEPRIAARGTVGGWPGYHTHFTPLPAALTKPKD